MAKRESAPFMIQRLSGSAGDWARNGAGCIWVDVTNPDREGEDFSSTAECEAWLKKNSEMFGNLEPTVRIVQVKRCMKMEVQVKKLVTFEDQQLPTAPPGEETDGEED